ncbi:hypothetical protein WJX72_012012 [[Myrmecia] bisecta]|uniref:Zinc-finger domain-containing protein n=1 Tax=[Myrmecia] bisecta TaxID=41462 RepID=A0AAW1P594_9CHLO
MAAVYSSAPLNEYEQEREERIARNKERLAELGLLKQKTLLEACFNSVKRPNSRSAPPLKPKAPSVPARSSQRLKGSQPDYKEVSIYAHEAADGRIVLPKDVSGEVDSAWLESMKQRRCNSKGRGTIYDNHAGITCHFCRQKKLCGEENCPRCSERDTDKDCTGKSECSKCTSACGRFCRACLLVRYGQTLEDVRAEMAAGTWLCPHCYEEEHPDEGWICNSSICMTRRGLKPTGIAIFDAQKCGFLSVAHYVQAGMQRRQGTKVQPAAGSATPATTNVGASSSGAMAAPASTQAVKFAVATPGRDIASDATAPATEAFAGQGSSATSEPWKKISEERKATAGRKRKVGAAAWEAGAAALSRRATTRSAAATKVRSTRRTQ